MIKERLSIEKITNAATQILNKVGMESFTMAYLAEYLGVTSPNIYKHFSGIEPLLDAITINSFIHLKNVTLLAAFGKSGSDALIAIARAYREFGREFPGEFACTSLRSDPSKKDIAQLREEMTEIYARIFGEKSNSESVIHKIRVFRSLVFGFVTLESQGAFGNRRSLDKSFFLLEQAINQIEFFDKEESNKNINLD